MPVVVLTTAKIIGEKRKINHVKVLIVFGLLLQQTGRSCEWAAQTTYRLNENNLKVRSTSGYAAFVKLWINKHLVSRSGFKGI